MSDRKNSPFVVFGTQRSGTTFLITLLDSHPAICCAGELFKKNNARKEYSQFLYRNHQDKGINEFLDYFYRENNEYEASGFKVMLDQVNTAPEILRFIRDNDIKILQIERENSLKLFISHEIAMKSSVWASGRPVEQKSIYIDPAGIIDRLDEVNKNKEQVEKIASSFQRLKVTYENLVNDKENTLKQILNFLDVEDQIELKTKLVKINSEDLRDVIENYEAVCAVLESTPYKKYLE